MKRRLFSIVLALVMMCSLTVAALAAPPTPDSGEGIVWSDEARVGKDESAVIDFYALFDTNAYSGLDSLGFRLQASTALTAVKGTGVAFGFQMGYVPQKFWDEGVGNISGAGGSGGEDAYGVKITFPKVPETTPLSVETVQLFKVIDKNDPDIETALPAGSITTDVGAVIVQYPVTVNIVGTVPSGASVSVKATDYQTANATPVTHTTYNQSGTATTINSGDVIWVDSGAGQQNTPNLDLAIPDGYAAQCYIVDTPTPPATVAEDVTQYQTAGVLQTLGAINTSRTVFVRFIKQFTLTFDPNGGTPAPAAVKKYATDPDYTIEQTVAKDNMTFDGWYNGDTKVTTWNTDADLTVKAKFSPLPDVEIPSTYKFVISAPTTLRTNESCTSAKVQLAADQINQLGYPQAKLVVEMTAQPDGSNPVVTAPVLGNLIGLNTPFAVTKDFSQEISLSELKADKAGTYTMKVSLLDGANGDAVICEATHTIVVSDNQGTDRHVEFDAKGGTPAPADQWVKDGETATAPTSPKKTGYTFAGWYLPDGTKYDFSKPVTGDLKLTAKYNKTNTGTVDPTTPGTVTSGKTGDASNMGLWIAVLGVSVLGVCGCGIYSKKKKSRTE